MKRILRSCRDCEHFCDSECLKYDKADDCPFLRAELHGVEQPRQEREETFGFLDGFVKGERERPRARPSLLEGARGQGPEEVCLLAVTLLKLAGFSVREVGDLCQSGWSREKVRRT